MKALVRILAGRNFSLSFSVFEASLIVGVSKISRRFNRFLQRKGDGCIKDTDHRISHPCVHLDDLASLLTRRGYAWRDDQFGRGQNTVLGWSDPTFGHLLVARLLGSLQPATKFRSLSCPRAAPDSVRNA